MYSDELNELAGEKLDRMGSFYPEPAKEFRKELFCFIAACRSSIDAILCDYAERYKLQIEDANNLGPKVFKERAIKANNADALRFIDWYDSEIKRLDRENNVWNHIVGLRRDNAGNLAIHKRKSSPDHNFVSVGGTEEEDYWVFDGVEERDVLEVCAELHDRVKGFLEEAEAKFP
jgi:hypothetical protein